MSFSVTESDLRGGAVKMIWKSVSLRQPTVVSPRATAVTFSIVWEEDGSVGEQPEEMRPGHIDSLGALPTS